MTRRSLTRNQRVRVFDEANGVCHICGQKITVGQEWEVEHIIPIGLTGSDKPENMHPAHIKCHKSKTRADKKQIAKAVRQRANHLGVKRKQGRPMAGTVASGWKKKMDGTAVRRV